MTHTSQNREGDPTASVVALIPRVALRVPREAAEALGVSSDYFDKRVRADLKLVRRGGLVLVDVRELQRWLEQNGARTLEP